MPKRYSTMFDHRWSKLAWLSLALLAGVTIYTLDPTARTDVEVGVNLSFPAHWCIPGTAGEAAIDTDGDVEVGENLCYPVHWCIPGTAVEESEIKLAPTSDTQPSAKRIAELAGHCSFRKLDQQCLLTVSISARSAIGGIS